MSAGSKLSRAVAVAGMAWGAALAARGPEIWRAVQGSTPSEADGVAVRILAARHLGQGSLQALLPTHLRGLWVAVDLLHAATMALLAGRDSSRRRAALVSGGAAAASALGTAISLGRSRSERR